MEPVEINAGSYYLRQLRADKLLDDRPALIEAFADPVHRRYVLNYRLRDLDEATEYVLLRTAQWAGDERSSWAIAEPTTGDLLGEVGLRDLDLDAGYAEAAVWVRAASRRQGVASTALAAALRFGFGGLGLREVSYRYEETNTVSASVARRCGFTLAGPEPELAPTGERLIRWTKTE
ncbi:GNAT family N-acetyltransferase [Amycolatopsis sp. H20-H5]|uniref:GNAT family N-acetyltransferase n=1 Tax=Amycolatopsis sp. H20-H5 TaxID=3046309 RepID=UPI002DB94D31|nr:GNAT family N-acetyltransferase [Amycolatopsis sp. H20-H5]MEC3978133.1 GNAT family N-acetyltransferase [Amycolatopsis sp. H20-H5]